MNTIESFLLNQAIRASVLLIVAFLATFAMRQASASARRLVWIATTACLLAMPVLSLLLPPIAVRTAWSVPAQSVAATSFQTTASPARTSPAAATQHAPASGTSWILMAWAAGVLAVLARLMAGMIRLLWLKRHARPLEPAGLVPCLETDRAVMPMTWGVFQPVILLPAGHRVWPEERLRLVRAHELIHVEQRDCLFQLLMQMACALYWFHPLIWIAAAQFRKERERACDDGVLRLGFSGPEYAGHLLELVRTLQPGTAPVPAVAMAHQSHLESRLIALLDAKVNREKLGRRAALGMACAAACLLVPIAAVRGQAPAARAAISGVVYDASGAVIPFATVLAANVDAKTKETATAGAAGEYSLEAIPAGHYTLEVSSPGFKIYRKDVTLNANEPRRMDIHMELGSITERVEVIGKKPAALVAHAAVPHRIRVGGNVVAAKLISKVAPIYPQYAQEKGIEGSVLLEAVISTEGSILSVNVMNTADADLSRAASNAVQQWHYQPTLLNGQPVEVVTTITVDFRLKP